MKRGIFHLHSTFSYDGLNRIKSIKNYAEKNRLNFVILTDHDTISGSKALSKLIFEENLKIEVPIGAEYKTSEGDIIALFIESEIQIKEWDRFLLEVKKQNGILILPHPYDFHNNVEKLASIVDVIEVFNARSSAVNNVKSYLLARKLNKPMIWGSDSHVFFTLNNVVVCYDSSFDTLRSAILNNNMIPYLVKNSSSLDLFLSQLKKAVVNRNIKLLLFVIVIFFIKIFKSDTK